MSEEVGFVGGRITADGIVGVEFPIRVRGYDRDEVDAFLAVVAQEMRQLLDAAGEVDDGKPYERLGSDAGRLLQLAQDAADRIREDSLAEAASLRQSAEQELSEARAEASRLRSEADRDAAEIVTGAQKEAGLIRDGAKGLRAEAESEAAQIRGDAEAEAREVRDRARAEYTVLLREAKRKGDAFEKQARQHAEQIRDSADEEAMARVQKARSEIRRLRDMETALRSRIDALEAMAAGPDIDISDADSDPYAILRSEASRSS